MSLVKFDKQIKALRDKAQAKFNQDLTLKVEKPATFTATTIDRPLYCPFCLYRAYISKFLLSPEKKGKGFSSKAKCPDCKNTMLLRSLTIKTSVEGYAKWVFEYASSGFWKKCPYEKWSVRLRDLGWSQEFWNRYKELKGDSEPTERYDEWLYRRQKEQAEEEGWV